MLDLLTEHEMSKQLRVSVASLGDGACWGAGRSSTKSVRWSDIDRKTLKHGSRASRPVALALSVRKPDLKQLAARHEPMLQSYNTTMVRLEQFLNSWTAVREDAALAVEEFPELDYRPTTDVESFRQIARHILNAGDGLTGMLLAREEVTGQEFRDRMKAHFRPLAEDASAAEVAAAMRESVAERCEQLAAQPPEFFSGMMTRHFDLQRLTRMEMLQFIKEHELMHRSQLFMYLRLKGIVPATTRRRLAKQASTASSR